MKRLAALLLAAAATPALAQHQHHAPAEPVEVTSHDHARHADHTDHADTGALSSDHETADHTSEAPPADSHSGQDHSGQDHAAHGQSVHGQSGRPPSEAPPASPPPAPPPHDAHAGHAMPHAPSQEAHAAHAGHAPGIPDPPVSPPSAAALSGPVHAADAIFGTPAMAAAREVVRREHGDIKSGTVLIDQLEAAFGNGDEHLAWKAEGWYGGDIDRLWVKTEGASGLGEKPEHVEVQALWSRALDPWWNLQTGIRHDFAGPDRTYAVLGIKGLAPYWFEIDGAVFLSHKGEVTARIEAEYDQRLTRKLILQPRAELDFSAQDVAELRQGSGLSTAELALRLRYQPIPEIAPYIGIGYERAFGDTARFRRAEGKEADGWNVLIGIRSWF